MNNSKYPRLNLLTVSLFSVCILLIIIICILLINMKSSNKTEQPEKQQASFSETKQLDEKQRPPSIIGVSRENPIPLGVSAIMYDGIELTVLSFDGDAWPKIHAYNSFNDPPANNKRMVMVHIRVKNVAGQRSGKIREPMRWGVYDEVTLVGSYNIVWRIKDSTSTCGVVPDSFGDAELYRNAVMEGNVCFQIPIDETNLLLRYDENDTSATRNYRYFSVEK